jgi:hypothetical protein
MCCCSIDSFLATDDHQLLALVKSATPSQAADHPRLAVAQHLLTRLDFCKPYLMVANLNVSLKTECTAVVEHTRVSNISSPLTYHQGHLECNQTMAWRICFGANAFSPPVLHTTPCRVSKLCNQYLQLVLQWCHVLQVPEQWVTKANWDGQQQQQGGVPGKKAAATAQEVVACWRPDSSSSSSVRLDAEELWVSCVKCDYGR